jgi:hypothetical protein
MAKAASARTTTACPRAWDRSMTGRRVPLPRVSTVNVAWPERGGQAVPVLVEDEERMIADGLDVAVGGRLLVRAVNRALRAVDIQDQPPREKAGRLMLPQVRIEASESW